MSFSPKTPPISTVYDSLELQGRQIRLLEIISTSPEIICKLQVAQLEHDLAFSALSYVWGNPEATRGISVNGIRIQVTTNLASALECAPGHLRQAGVAAKLWVDAVCINQDDADEKNHQVPLMADVYSSAQLVLCWFGPANESIHKSMDWVELVARERPLEDDVHKMYSLLKRDNYTRNLAWLQKYPELINWEGSRPEESCGLMAALDLFDLPYWSRAWIFQEVVLPKQPVFVCGNRSLSLASLQTFERWMWWFTILPAPTRPDFFPSTVWALMTNTNYYGFKRIRRVFKARKAVFHAADTASEAASAKSDNGADNSAWDDWSVSTTCMASEPKDYIYSFLAISGLGLVPDYRPEKSVGQVCREFLLEYVREYRRKGSGEDRRGELHLLRFAGVGNGWRMYLDTPSWAPNFPGMCWTRHNDRKSMGLGMNSEKQVDGEAEMFHSCAKAEFVAEKLVVAAVILDAVQAAGPLRGDFGDVDTILQRE
ncbi:heterokaryon incompatibility protein-domain-containing protein, partial [Thelonectria olida]